MNTPTLPPNPYTPEDYSAREDGFVSCPGALQGVDVSEHQLDIDWQRVHDFGIDFAILRLGFRGYGESGILVEDRQFPQNYTGAMEAGLKVGVYFYSQAVTLEEAVQEAEYVLDVLHGRELALPVFFDWEEQAAGRTAGKATAQVSDYAQAFCGRITEAGYEAGVYFNQDYARSVFYLETLGEYPYWLAEYNTRQSFPYQVQFWQYNNVGHVDGIETIVDLNLMYAQGD